MGFYGLQFEEESSFFYLGFGVETIFIIEVTQHNERDFYYLDFYKFIEK